MEEYEKCVEKIGKYYWSYYSKPENVINAVAMSRGAGGARSVRSLKLPKITESIGNGKYTKTTWTVNARSAGGAARAVYVKIKDGFGKTVRFYKDTFDTNNKFWHRKIKL